MEIISVNVGRPQVVIRFGRLYSTAINKQPVLGACELTTSGFAGDRSADSIAHGGSELAACCYPHEHYPAIAKKLETDLAVPSFGENLTTIGLLEDTCCIGDTFKIGSATVQISQPREPCAKLARKHRAPGLIEWILYSGHSGFYLRVLEPGAVAAPDTIELLGRPHPALTVVKTMQAMHADSPPRDLANALLNCPTLSPHWKSRLADKLAR